MKYVLNNKSGCRAGCPHSAGVKFCRLVMGSDLLFLLEKSKTGNEENRRAADHAKVHLKTKKRTDISQT